MIDTITLTTNDFEIDWEKNQSSQYPLIAKIGEVPADANKIELPVLLRDIHQKEIFGSCLTIHKSKDFNPTGTIRKTGILKIAKFGLSNTKDVYLSFQCSIPKFLTGENFYLANNADVLRFAKELTQEFYEMGIYCDVEKMKVARLDLTRNLETEFNISAYIPVLKMCNANRSFNSEINARTYTTGTGKGKSSVICCYDKLEEISNNGETIPQGLENSNIVRIESRSLQSRTVYSKTKIEIFSDIPKMYGDLKSCYIADVQKNLFGNFNKSQLKDFNSYDLDTLAKHFIYLNNGKISWVKDFLFASSLINSQEFFKQVYDNLDDVLAPYYEFLLEQGKDLNNAKVYKTRCKKVLKEQLEKAFFLIKNDFEMPYLKLLEELQEKLCA